MAVLVDRQRFTLTSRIRALAAAAAERAKGAPGVNRTAVQTEAYFGGYAELPLWERQARSLADAMVAEPVLLFPGERVNGIFYHGADPQWHDPAWGEHSASIAAWRRVAAEVPEMTPLADQGGGESFIIDGGAAPGHIAWNYDLVLALGVRGLAEQHRQALAATADPRAREYYQGVLILLDAVLEWNRRHVEALRAMLSEADGDTERSFIERNLRIMEQVPARPARSFHEAVQSFNFQWLAVMYEAPYGGNSPGRLDQLLWPYLQPEYEAGLLSYQDAAELIAELFLKIDERVHLSDGHVNTIVVGGVTPAGGDAVNPLSYMMLDVFEQLDLTHPAVYTRVSEANPPEWHERCVAYLVTGGNRAQILADEPILRAMTRGGRMPYADAARYMCGGCMEIGPHGLNSDLLFSFIYNIPKTLELVLTGGECLTTGRQRLDVPGPLGEFDGFEALYAAFEAEMRRALLAKFRCLDIWSEEMARCRPLFLLSSMVGDCLERGRSQQDGGARYADYGGTPLGIQNAADALYAVQRAIFDGGFCTPDELLAALRDDFVGHAPLHRRLLTIPKYGAGDAGADAMMGRVLRSVLAIFDSWRNRHGRFVKPIIFTFVWAPQMGRSLGASPDGRRAGQPIGHGLTPQACGMTRGLTASIESYVKLPNELVSGGASTMWDIDAAWA
ncbi:MAG: pyruvate formate lyase family protein, partial [Armatimonadetes bacterium]|nr:pyruvate formate lyase family protein [Armatimonadota bacterium]